jgi:hypothetical protein
MRAWFGPQILIYDYDRYKYKRIKFSRTKQN